MRFEIYFAASINPYYKLYLLFYVGGGYIQLTPPPAFVYYLGVGLGGAVCEHAMFKFQSANSWLSGSYFMEIEKHNKPIHMAREWSFNWIKNLIREYKLT